MIINYKPGTEYSGPRQFSYSEGSRVTIVVRHWLEENASDSIYYHGEITSLDEERQGFWAVLEDDENQEEFFHFGDIEAVIPGDEVPSDIGTKKRV